MLALRRSPAFLLLLALAAGSPAGAGEPPQETYGDEITVALDTLVVRIVDPSGAPILGLTPADFRVEVHGKEVPVASVDWVSSVPSAVPLAEASIGPSQEVVFPGEASPAGKLVVLFVQADLNPTRISGQLRLRPFTRQLLATLAPADRVAVVSFDSHLKLWLDFTADREAVLAAIDRGMLYTQEEEIAAGPSPSLAASFDSDKAKRVASPERALEFTARSLAPLPGEKTMIFLGWGLGRFGGDGVRMTPAFDPAVQALLQARVSVFVLDVTSADSHSLGAGLEAVAAATGGTYASTFRLPGLATSRLARAISGWYVLTFDRDGLGGIRPGEAKIRLRGRRGEVLARPAVLR